MKKQIGRMAQRLESSTVFHAETLRISILEERHLQRSVAQEEDLRLTNPDMWRAREAARLAANRDLAPTNRRLRALGLRPVESQPSLAQKRQELQRLKKRNVAAIAAFKAAQSKSEPQTSGTRDAHQPGGD